MSSEDWMDDVLAHLDRGDLSAAVAGCERVLRDEPDNEHALFQLALLEIEQERYTAAVEHLRGAARAWEDVAEVFEKLGLALTRLAAFQEARDALSRALELDPGRPEDDAVRRRVLGGADRARQVKEVLADDAAVVQPGAAELVPHHLAEGVEALRAAHRDHGDVPVDLVADEIGLERHTSP